MAVAVEAADEAVVEDDAGLWAALLASPGVTVWDWSLVVSPSTGWLSSVDMRTPVELLLEFSARRRALRATPVQTSFRLWPARRVENAQGEAFQAMTFGYNAAVGDCADRKRFKAGMRAVLCWKKYRVKSRFPSCPWITRVIR
jgi:hypothetical protein